MRTQLVAKCRTVTLDQITEVDEELLAARYEAAIMTIYEDLATGFFNRPLEELISKSRDGGRVQIQASEWFLLHIDEIVREYDYGVVLVGRISGEGAKALTASCAKYLTDHSSEVAALDLEETLVAMANIGLVRRILSIRLGRCLAVSESAFR